MTLAAVAFHGVASSIGAWRRDVRRYARLARAGCSVAPLSTVRQPLPATLFGDALMSLCGDRLRGALEAPYAPAHDTAVEREPRPRVPDARPRSSGDTARMSSHASTAAVAGESRDWRPVENRDDGSRRESSERNDVVQYGDAAWKTSANGDDASPRADAPVSLGAHTTTHDRTSAARVGDHTRARSSSEAQSPLTIALRRLQRASTTSAPTAAPRTSATAPLSQHDAVAIRETSHADRTQRSLAVRSTDGERGSPASDNASPVHSPSAARQPWWASGVEEIHSRNVQRAPIAQPIASTVDAPEEAFAEMLADVLRQQAMQHGVLVP